MINGNPSIVNLRKLHDQSCALAHRTAQEIEEDGEGEEEAGKQAHNGKNRENLGHISTQQLLAPKQQNTSPFTYDNQHAAHTPHSSQHTLHLNSYGARPRSQSYFLSSFSNSKELAPSDTASTPSTQLSAAWASKSAGILRTPSSLTSTNAEGCSNQSVLINSNLSRLFRTRKPSSEPLGCNALEVCVYVGGGGGDREIGKPHWSRL